MIILSSKKTQYLKSINIFFKYFAYILVFSNLNPTHFFKNIFIIIVSFVPFE